MRSSLIFSLSIAFLLITSAPSAEAYIGPGAGISAIGTVIALVGAVLLAIVGFVWYPVKRLMAKKKASAAVGTTSDLSSAPQSMHTSDNEPPER